MIMPEVRCFIDQEIYKMLDELENKYKLGQKCEIVVIAISLLYKMLQWCEENNVKAEECFDKCIRFIIERY